MIRGVLRVVCAAFFFFSFGWECTRAGLVDVSLTLNVEETAPGSGTFELLATANSSLNAGLASYNVPLTGGILSLDHKSPNGVGLNSTTLSPGDIGFLLFRSPDNVTDIEASQDTVGPNGMIIYDMGILGGDISTSATPAPLSVFFSEQPIYTAPLLLADGLWSGTLPAFSTSTTDPIGGNVFDLARNKTTFEGNFATTVNFTPIPEPSAAMMLLLPFAGVVSVSFASRIRRVIEAGMKLGFSRHLR